MEERAWLSVKLRGARSKPFFCRGRNGSLSKLDAGTKISFSAVRPTLQQERTYLETLKYFLRLFCRNPVGGGTNFFVSSRCRSAKTKGFLFDWGLHRLGTIVFLGFGLRQIMRRLRKFIHSLFRWEGGSVDGQ